MSVYPILYNGVFGSVFNSNDFQEPTYINNLTTDSINSSSISSSDIQVSSIGGSDTVATQPYVATQIGTAITSLLSNNNTYTGINIFSNGIDVSGNVSLPNNSISDIMIDNNCINNGYVDATSSIQNQLNGKQDTLVYDSAPTSESTNMVNSGDIYNVTSNLQSQITSLDTVTTGLSYSSGTTTLSENLACNNGISVTGSVSLPNNSISDVMIDNTAISSGYVDASSSIQTQLNSKANSSSPTFIGIVTLPSTVDNGTFTANNGINCPSGNVIIGNTLLVGSIDLSGNIISNGSTITPTQIGYVSGVSSSIQTQLNGKQATLTFDSTPTASSTNPVTSGGIYTSLENYLTTSSASSTYLSISNASSTYAPKSNASLTGITSVVEVSEAVYDSGSGSNLSLTYTSVDGIIYYSPSSNFTLTLSSVPTGSTNSTYSLTFVYNTQYYCDAISVNGTSRTMTAGNGLANISVSSSASYVIQQVNICFLNSSTPTVFTNVLSMW